MPRRQWGIRRDSSKILQNGPLTGIVYCDRFTIVHLTHLLRPPKVIAMSAPRLGRVQLRIVQVLWEKRRANAREITDALNRGAHGPIAHSTVQTLLRKLETKGAVAHDVEDRTFVFHPLVEEDCVKRGATRELLDRVFEGSAAGLVAYLLENERVSGKELAQIRELIDESKTN